LLAIVWLLTCRSHHLGGSKGISGCGWAEAAKQFGSKLVWHGIYFIIPGYSSRIFVFFKFFNPSLIN
jgi:hypothetical protein